MIGSGVVLTRETRTPPWRGARAAVVDAVAFGAATVLLVGAVVVAPSAYLATVGAVLACEAVLVQRPNLLSWVAELSHAGPFWRGSLRGATACLLVAGRGGLDTGLGDGFVWVTITWLVVQLTGAGARAGLELVSYLRRSPVLTRNVDLTPLGLPPPPPRVVTRRAAVLTGMLDVPVVVGTGVAVNLGVPWALPAGAVVSLLAAVTTLGVIGLAVLRLRRRNPRRLVPALVQRTLADLRPEVLLYFAGRPSTLYQAQMWLEAAEKLRRPTLVVLRDRESLLRLEETTLPVVCVPSAAALASLELPTARVVLMAANAAENIHMLRRRGLASVFIGHGDSDKAYSANPFVRTYDEVWVAGPAGRARFVDADVALPATRVVEVGRPQVALVRPRHRTDSTFTVLYAPTWEGWGDVAFHTSLPLVGPALVRALLARPGVRVVYRPHPLTGTRDGATRTAHERIVSLLGHAGARRSPGRGIAGGAPPEFGADALQHSVEHSRPTFERATTDAARDAAEVAYWGGRPPGAHVVVEGWPGLESCFGESDLLVADVSSVISDWLGTDRPYAVLNASDAPTWEFSDQYPSARGGRVIGRDLTGLQSLLDDLSAGLDPDAAARKVERERLLGPHPEDSMTRFADAVDRLCPRDDLVAPTRKDA
jgi:hypothetical protein